MDSLLEKLVKMRVEWLVSSEFVPLQDAVDCAGDLSRILREFMTKEKFEEIAIPYADERRQYYTIRKGGKHGK